MELPQLLNCGVGEDSWESLGQQGDQTSQCSRKTVLNIHCKNWCWSSNPLATWCEVPTHWKRLWCWERLRAGGEAGNKGWDGWMASLTQWTWVWANSKRQWKTGKSGMLQSMGLQRVGHNWVTKWQQAFFNLRVVPFWSLDDYLWLCDSLFVCIRRGKGTSPQQ